VSCFHAWASDNTGPIDATFIFRLVDVAADLFFHGLHEKQKMRRSGLWVLMSIHGGLRQHWLQLPYRLLLLLGWALQPRRAGTN
jgi:hypothetical protein